MIIGIRHMPLDEWRVTSEFGMRDLLGYWWHNGLDLKAAEGEQVYAVAGGVVKNTVNNPAGYGQYVVINHGNWGTLYAHLSKIMVRDGQRVDAGCVLGLSGNTGMSTGPHLHIEVRIGNWSTFWDKVYINGSIYLRCVDPQPLFERVCIGMNVNFDEAEDIVRTRALLEDKTMNFLKAYKYSEDLFLKLAKCII